MDLASKEIRLICPFVSTIQKGVCAKKQQSWIRPFEGDFVYGAYIKPRVIFSTNKSAFRSAQKINSDPDEAIRKGPGASNDGKKSLTMEQQAWMKMYLLLKMADFPMLC